MTSNEEVRALCRNSDLIEELGQVTQVFCDKTGTLTLNEMVFRMCGIGSRVYGGQVEDSRGRAQWVDYS